ncbi:MAG TPA: ABC transporter permease subunit [Phycisphaerae bacterium]|nr:ABC transporter permease subunit [Phycisphaerae bacterium]
MTTDPRHATLLPVRCLACGADSVAGSVRCAACGRSLRPGVLTAIVVVHLVASQVVAPLAVVGAYLQTSPLAAALLAVAAVVEIATIVVLVNLLRGRYWAWLAIQVRWELDIVACLVAGAALLTIIPPWQAVAVTAAGVALKVACWVYLHKDRVKTFSCVGARGGWFFKASLYAALAVWLVVALTPLVWLVAASLKNSDDLFHYTFFPPPSHLSAENFERLFGSPNLALNEVRDWPGLAAKLEGAAKAEPDSLGKSIWQALDPGGREKLTDAARAGKVSPDEERLLLGVLNVVLARPDLFRPEQFLGLKLRAEAQPLVERFGVDLPRDEAHRLNRFVLEVAYPQEVARAVLPIPFGRYVVNSLFIAGVTVLIQIFFSSLGGFALAKYEFRFKGIILVVMLATMMIPGQVMLAPLYELIYKMRLTDSHLGLIVPSIVSVFGMWLFRQSMLQIPDELLEAGRMDGCTEFGLYWNIALPVSRPMIGAFCLFAFMGSWNSFLWPQIILHTQELFTIPIGLNQMVGTYSQQYGMMMAGTLLAILPVMVLFLVFQREFISGLTAGAVKG